MSAPRKLKSMRVVRLGDLLFNEHQLVLLCRQCKRCFMELNIFHSHLKKCTGIEHIVTPIDELHYDEAKCETIQLNGKHEVLQIYDIEAVEVRSANDKMESQHIGLDIDWEAELDDPRWYTEEKLPVVVPAKPKQIHAKENMAKTHTRSQTNRQQQQHQQPAKQQRSLSLPAGSKRSILMNQQQRRSLNATTAANKTKKQVYVVPSVVADLKRLEASEMKTAAPTAIPTESKIENATAECAAKDTQHILNKLRACGVEVKRRNTRDESVVTTPIDATPNKIQQALHKLQSKGIKCTKVNNAKKQKLDLG